MADRITRVKCDPAGLVRIIEQVGERAVKGISTVMHTYADLMLADAIKYAPHDTGSLERAIRIQYDRSGINTRLKVKIWIDLTAAYEGKQGKGTKKRKTVGDYAFLMEKYLRPHGSGGYKAREGTLNKGVVAGGKFLERAVKKYRQTLIKRARLMAKRAAARV